MKKNKKKQIIDAENDRAEFFRLLMWHSGITYPKHIFERRLDLLKKKERKRYEKEIRNLLDVIDQFLINKIEDIDQIMSIRAEEERDEWG